MAKAGKRGRGTTPKARQASAAAPQRGAEYLDLVTRAINEGVYDLDLVAGTAYFSEGVQRATGMTPRQLRTPQDWRKRIHPDDRPTYDAALVAHFKGKTERFECDYRFRALDGRWRWARQHGIAVRDEKGRAIRMVGSTGDISELKRIEQALKESEERYSLASNAATEGIYDWDMKTDALFLSDRAREFFAFAGKNLTPKSWNARVHKEDFPAYRDAVIRCLKGRTGRLEMEYRVKDVAGGWKWIFDRGVVVRDAKKRAIRLVGAVSDITRRKAAEAELRRARDEATEALERQTATAEILKVMARSPSDVRPVFDAIASGATRLCDASYCIVFQYDGKMITVAADDGRSRGSVNIVKASYPAPPGKQSIAARAILERRVISIADAQNEPDKAVRARARAIGYRSILAVPMMKGNAAIGAINVVRVEANPFTDAQVDLLKTFADQAVIAVENVRLFNETREALERQTATAEILKVIASSPSDVQPVLDVIATSAARLLSGHTGSVTRIEDGVEHLGAFTSLSAQADEALTATFPRPIALASASSLAVIASRKPHVIEDYELDPTVSLQTRSVARKRGYRSIVVVPLLRNGIVVGTVRVTRAVAGSVPENQIDLLQTFADQAVIAIENVRLFNETKEALEQQKATADVLASISGSMTDAQPVFDRIVKSLAELFGSRFAVLQILRGDMVEMPAVAGKRIQGLRKRYPRPLDDTTVGGRAMLSRKTIQLTPVIGNPDTPPATVQFAKDFGFDSVIFTPMIHQGKVIGAISAAHEGAKPFDERQVALIKTFADQAVVAIENARLFNETKEALERQTATAEILRVIASSPSDVQPVLDAVSKSAHRLIGGFSCAIARVVGDELQLAAFTSSSETGDEALKAAGDEALKAAYPISISGSEFLGGIVRSGTAEFMSDVSTDPRAKPKFREAASKRGYRAVLVVPMVREGATIGLIQVTHVNPGPFSSRHIELLKTFADQAVIAIENVRLFNETKEALERQTATAEILKVIASSPADVQPVFDAIAASSNRLLDGFSTAVVRVVDGVMHLVGQTSTSEAGDAALKKSFPRPVEDSSAVDRAIRDCVPVSVIDTEVDAWATPNLRGIARARGFRSVLFVPLIQNGVAVGTISVTRRMPGEFAKHQVDLLKTFADQAVIAIENVRLFNETKESLERQTATAEILRVIASSPSDVQPVFDAIVENAIRLLRAHTGHATRRVGDSVHLVAYSSSDASGEEALKKIYPMPIAGSINETMVATGEPYAVGDMESDARVPDVIRNASRARGTRSFVVAPMMAKGEFVGGLIVTRPTAGDFSAHEVGLLKTFADQAVIAIENVRLFNETKEALERQTATAEILKVIASSPSEVQPVFDAVTRNAALLCGANDVVIRLVDGDMHRAVAHYGTIPPVKPLPVRGSIAGRAMQERMPLQIADLLDPGVREEFREADATTPGYRTFLAAPLLRENAAVGAIIMRRVEVAPFTDKQIALLQTFADQAVIAIENVRLFNETKEALEQQTATAKVLRVIGGALTDTQPVFDEIVSSAASIFDRKARIRLIEGERLRLCARSDAATANESTELYLPIDQESLVGRVILSRKALQISDTQAPDEQSTFVQASAKRVGYRAMAIAPLIREGKTIGAIGVHSPEAGALTEKKMALLQTFADQAVIAIENVRLFKELQARTEALTKSVGQLTALGEVGQAIGATLDLETVLQTIVTHAVKLTGLDAGGIYEYDEALEEFRLRAAEGMSGEITDNLRNQPIRKGEGAVGSTAVTREPVQVADVQVEGYDSRLREILLRSGRRAVLAVPLVREDRIFGALAVQKAAPGPFAPEVVELLKTFASQSAMTIQNARLFREIAEKGKQLEIASRHKSDFLANMSHELRTPLNAIIGFSEVLNERLFGELNEKQADYMKDIHESGRHLLSLINDILDLSKIEAGRMDLDIAHFDLPAALANAITLVRERAQHHGIALGLTVDPALGEFAADERKFKQILLNLLSNAVKFTPDGGRVDVSAALNGAAVSIAVKDTGVGIAAGDHAAVFEEFRQVGSDYTRKSEGTGLGLALTRRFVELHGGEIRLESEPGKGSTFTFTLPVRP